jgi:myosin heavy subunit
LPRKAEIQQSVKEEYKMKKALITVIIVLGLGLAGSIYFGFTLMQDKNALTNELNSTRDALASTQEELDATQQELSDTELKLASTQAELGSTASRLTSTQSELDTAKDTLASTQSELEATNEKLTSKTAELVSAEAELASTRKSLTTFESNLADTQKKLDAAQETLDGLGISVAASAQCFDADLVDNPAAKNPTWQELKSFLKQDKTENHPYILNEYDCSEFSRDVHNNAEAAGIRSAEVQVFFKNEEAAHALDAFLTTDYGLIFVDCTKGPDKIAYLKAGKTFKAVPIDWMATASNARNDAWWDSQTSYFYMPSKTGGQMKTYKIRIFW